MKNKKAKILCKKSISLLLALLLVLTAVPLGGLTAFAAAGGDFEYSVLSEEEQTCEITQYIGTAKVVVVPSEIDGYTVTRIDNWAFKGCSFLKIVTIPDSVSQMGTGVFEDCNALTDIHVDTNNPFFSSIDGVVFNKPQTILYAYPKGKPAKSYSIPDGVTTIWWLAFLSCSNLTSVTLPDSVTDIGDYAFMYCTALERIIIGHGVTNIEMCAFAHCTTLKSVSIPDSVADIGFSAFIGCTSLTNVMIYNYATNIEESGLGYYVDYLDSANGTFKKVDDFAIYGEKGSTAETYANKNEFPFIPIKKFFDADSGILMTVTHADSLAKDTVLNVKTVGITDHAIIYDISLTANGESVQPAAPVTVKIPVPDTMNGADCKVYRQETDGTYTDMQAVYQSGYMVFTTDHFSIYMLTTKDPNAPDIAMGDLNNDGQITAVDARWALQAASGTRPLSNEQTQIADVNGDGQITAVDARWILQAASGTRAL